MSVKWKKVLRVKEYVQLQRRCHSKQFSWRLVRQPWNVAHKNSLRESSREESAPTLYWGCSCTGIQFSITSSNPAKVGPHYCIIINKIYWQTSVTVVLSLTLHNVHIQMPINLLIVTRTTCISFWLCRRKVQLDSNGYSALHSPPRLMRWTHKQRDGRQATQYLLCSLSDGERNNDKTKLLEEKHWLYWHYDMVDNDRIRWHQQWTKSCRDFGKLHPRTLEDLSKNSISV